MCLNKCTDVFREHSTRVVYIYINNQHLHLACVLHVKFNISPLCKLYI